MWMLVIVGPCGCTQTSFSCVVVKPARILGAIAVTAISQFMKMFFFDFFRKGPLLIFFTLHI